jgi:AraC-like DNA-binding protein
VDLSIQDTGVQFAFYALTVVIYIRNGTGMLLIPQRFAHAWRFCLLRLTYANRHVLAAGAAALHRPKHQWRLYHLAQGRLQVACQRQQWSLRAPCTWMAAPTNSLRDIAGPGGAQVCEALFDVLPWNHGPNPLSDYAWPVLLPDHAHPAWDELLAQGAGPVRGRQAGLILQRATLEALVNGFLHAAFIDGRLQAGPAAGCHPWLDEVAAWAAARSTDPSFDVPALAQRSGYSLSQLWRAFVAVHGCGPGEFILRERLRNAARQLRANPACPVQQVARSCGFSRYDTFIRRFTARFGRSPGRWRKAEQDPGRPRGKGPG